MRKEKNNTLTLIVSLFVCIMLISGVFIATKLTAPKEDPSVLGKNPQYSVVQIDSGDSLWSIAEEYQDKSGYLDIRDYIKEIKKTNNLTSDDITSGCYLMIPYYDN